LSNSTFAASSLASGCEGGRADGDVARAQPASAAQTTTPRRCIRKG
jgi:hypothetical protein